MRRFKPIRKLLLVICSVFIVSTAFSQERTITGTITDGATDEPLAGATVVIQGTTTGATTDLDGNFQIQAKEGDFLVISFVGYLTETIAVGTESTVSMVLMPDLQALEEVVVIGYGTVKKEDATGSVAVVSSEDFNQGNITNAEQLMVGKTAGVVITSSGGAPTSGSTIRIRGGSSLRASNDPLIIVDGVPISNQDVSGNANIFSFVNPSDIETFTVLKDASATAIYGSRASNGVILITTKKGKAGSALKVNYTGNMSLSHAIEYADVYTGDELRQRANHYRDIYDPLVFNLLGTQNTDWQDEIFRTAYSHDHNLSVSGSANNLPYRASVGYTDQQGILKNTDMKRITATVALDPTFLNESLKVNVNAKFMHTKNNFGDAGAVGNAVAMDPTQPVKDGNPASDGYFQWENYGANLGTVNPVQQALETDNKSDVNRFVGNVQLDYSLPMLPELRAVLNVATDWSKGEGYNNRPTTSPTNLIAPLTNGSLNDYSNTNTNDLVDFYVNYAKDITADHNINVTAGYSWQHFAREGDSYTRQVIDSENPYREPTDSSEFKTENYLVSFFGRLNYSFMNRYLLTGTVRYDGSSRFAEDNRWGLFPSAAFAWKINEEAFMANVNVVSDLKLRLGWGITGQQDITDNDYPAQALYTESRIGSYYYHNGRYISTLRPDAYDPNIKWEETTTINAGLDYGFLNGRINGTVDVYQRETKDLLNQVTIPSGANFSNTIITNVGSLENKGIEFTVNAVAISKQDMSLDLGFNVTYNKTEITKLLISDDPNYIGILYGNAFTGFNQVTRVGESPYSFFVNEQVYDANDLPIEGLYVDRAGEGGEIAATNENKYIYNDPAPDYILGFNFRFAYKDFDLASSMRANIGNYVYNNVASGASFDQMQQIGYWRNMPKSLDNTMFVRRQFTSDYFVENASFLRMDYLSAGYNFNEIAGSKASLRLNFTINNVFTYTKYSGLDPEIGFSDGVPGVDNNQYPRPRTYTLGLSLTF
jgi:TonB-linked SusC/RagA family outer membrane protein